MGPTVRFVHTADWQLGFRRAYLDDDAQARFAQARIDVIGSIADLVREHSAEFVVVAGDVFDSNQTDRRTVHRALEQIGTIPAPVLLLPGNHDALDAGSIYRSPTFSDRCPDNIEVLDDASPRPVGRHAEVIGVPWTSNERLSDAVSARLAALAPAEDRTRIVVAHGIVDRLAVDRAAPGAIDTAAAERALADGRLQYLALGDRHSTTSIGRSGRVWYAGAPEPTRFTEIDAGNVLLVDSDATTCRVQRMRVGRWRFVHREVEIDDVDDVDAVTAWLDACDGPARTIARLRLSGVVPLRELARLTDAIEAATDRFACVDVHGLHDDLVAVADDEDVADLDAGPVTRGVLDELTHRATDGGEDGGVAAEALELLYRLVRRAA